MRNSQAACSTLVIPDLHAPYHDVEALAVVAAVARALRPDRAVIIGDVIDCYSCSDYTRDPARRNKLAEELDEAEPALRTLQSLAPLTYICEGNHETRFSRLIASRAPELHGITSIRKLLQADERQWHWSSYKTSLRLGKVSYSHDFGRSGVNATRQALVDVGGNCVFGHTHRLAVSYQGCIRGGSHVAMNVGHLSDVECVDYAHRDRARREWQTGFGLVDEDDQGNAWMQAVAIVKGSAVVHGRRITP